MTGNTSETTPIKQTDYDSDDWLLALGNIDRVDWEILAGPANDGAYTVDLTIIDHYEWHPDEGRVTSCPHKLMEAQKANGANNFDARGTGIVKLYLDGPPPPGP